MAMLFSVMSFAQEAIYTLDGTITGGSNGYADASSLTQDNIAWSVTGNTTMNPWRIGGKSITNQDRAVYSKNPLAYNIDKIELTHGTASNITVNSLKLIISDAANGAGETIDVTFKASATTTIDLPEGDYSNKYFKFLYNVTVSDSKNKYVEFKSAKFYAALAEDAVKAPVIKGAEDFISETEIAIEAEDDVTVYYTVDGTEPTTASTVYTAPFTVKETTTVKAVAYRGEKASFVTSATFTKATQLTCAEAAVEAMKVASNNATTNITYVVYGYVTELDGDLSSGQQKFWVSDTKGGENTFYSYFCNVPRALVVGDYIQMFGKLTKYNTTPQMKNGDITILPAPVAKYTVTATAENGTVEGAGEYEEGAEATLTATANEGYEFTCWTSGEDTVSTANPYTFTVTEDLALVANFKEAVKAIEVNVTDATATSGEWSIDLAGSWNDQALTIKLWQDNTQGFGSYAPNTETGYYILLGAKELTPTTAGVYADNGDGTFTFTCSATDGTTQYNITVTGTSGAQEVYYETFELTNLEVTDNETFLVLEASDMNMGLEVMLGVNMDGTLMDASQILFGGEVLPILSSEPVTVTFNEELQTEVYTARVVVEHMGGSLGLELIMYAGGATSEPIAVNIMGATAAVDEATDVLKITGDWDGIAFELRINAYDPAQTLYDTPQIAEFETEEVYATSGLVTVIKTGENIDVIGEFMSPMGDIYNVYVNAKFAAGPETGVDNIQVENTTVKVVEDGQVFIIRNGVKFNANGAILK